MTIKDPDPSQPASGPVAEGATAASEKRPRRWRRLSPDERRDQILDGACATAVKRHSLSVPLADIAQELGVSRNLVYHYFGNAAVLWEALYEREELELRRRISKTEEGPAERMPHAIAETFLAFFDERAAGLTLLLLSPKHQARLAPYLNENIEFAARRMGEAMGVPWEGDVKTALVSSTEFMLFSAFGLRIVPDRTEGLRKAAQVCVQVCRDAVAGALRAD